MATLMVFFFGIDMQYPITVGPRFNDPKNNEQPWFNEHFAADQFLM